MAVDFLPVGQLRDDRHGRLFHDPSCGRAVIHDSRSRTLPRAAATDA